MEACVFEYKITFLENLVSFGSLGDDALIWRATALNKTVNRYMNIKLILCWGTHKYYS